MSDPRRPWSVELDVFDTASIVGGLLALVGAAWLHPGAAVLLDGVTRED